MVAASQTSWWARGRAPHRDPEAPTVQGTELWPEKFNNKTNGITPRRWLKKANPRLSSLVSYAIGEKWVTDLGELKRLIPLATDAAFVEGWQQVKRANKDRLVRIVAEQYAHRGTPLAGSIPPRSSTAR